MSAVVIIGAQWGDEGKGKIVDLLAERSDVVARYAGGPNAGHTLVVGDDKIVLRLVPSGVLHPHTSCLLGRGMVINPATLVEELDILAERRISTAGRVWLAPEAQLILDVHILVDTLRESAASGTKIGTTKRGIGPCYEDKVGRRGVRAGDLRDLGRARERVAETLATWAPTITRLAGEVPSIEAVMAPLKAAAERLLPYLADTSAKLENDLLAGKKVMFEGAQGTLLDIDHGTYPYVTSSSAVAGGACTGMGVGPTRISHTLGITKAYTTRVGEGPFPTELHGEAGQHLRDRGGEYGSVTGRPRRTGWLDLAGLAYARRVNGISSLAVTKLDVLADLESIQLCTGYRTAAGEVKDLPLDAPDAEPIYTSVSGFEGDLSGCRKLADLPSGARAYLDVIQDETGLPISIVSVGPRRSETIVLRDPFA